MIVFFDFETGGVTDEAPDIQLAAVAVDKNWNEIGVFEEKIAFDVTLAAKEALDLNHYTLEGWKNAKEPGDVVRLFCKFLNDFKVVQMVSKRTNNPYMVARLAGHNVATFDMPRLRRIFGASFLPADPRALDTLQRALWFAQETGDWPENFRLETLCKHFGLEAIGAHDALADVRMSIALAKHFSGK
jgi:DNA polymerase III alpha subunit (gram-positive type)